MCSVHDTTGHDGHAVGLGAFRNILGSVPTAAQGRHCFGAEKVDDCPSADGGGQLLVDRQADMRLLNVFFVLTVVLTLAPGQVNSK